MRLILILLMIVSSTLLKAQIGNETLNFDTLTTDINNLIKTKNDTSIRFELPDRFYSYYDTLQGLSEIGKVQIFEVEYLIYKQNNKTFSKKYIYHCNKNCDTNIHSVSKPIEIKSDSIFILLNKTMNKIRHENILPYIFKIENTENNEIEFDVLRASHPSHYGIGIYTLKDNINTAIDMDGLTEQITEKYPKNLNYKSNASTNLNSFFQILKRFVDKNDRLYSFK